ncbi:hypothetical protein [Bacillus sp. AFS053548]|uniref:hypothetical protein n=1 Tax=Bacillus sp. AFS053548 TaxID=2033505 RepID=UPI000BFD1253|nr:hypothetical protein [Bacillus sp. AFS053548]PGM59903.1 hypothetical protein CN946_00400 [Bacillus sp. AFS053548]
MGVFINLQTEIEVQEHFEEYGMEMVKGRNKVVLNKNYDRYYLDLGSFALSIGISINQLLESINYIPTTGEYLAFYKNEQHKPIRVLEFTGLNELIRGLKALGFNLDLLKTIRDQCYKLHEQIKEKE